MIISNTQLNISVSASDFAPASVGVFPKVFLSVASVITQAISYSARAGMQHGVSKTPASLQSIFPIGLTS
jgi:hypothetical protein